MPGSGAGNDVPEVGTGLPVAPETSVMPLTASLVDSIGTLDPLPLTAQRLIQVVADEDSSFEDIVRVVEHDPAVGANVLRLANSTLYAGRFKVERLRDAVIRLGPATLMEIALGGYLKRVSCKAPMYDLSEDELFMHSAVASLAIQEISREASEVIPPTASLAALLHDIGKLIMARFQKVSAADVTRICEEKGVSFTEGERLLFGCDHAEVGGAIARSWDFPAGVVEAIERHHDFPLKSGSISLDAVVAANYIAKTIGVGLGAEGLNLKLDQDCLRRLGLEFDKFCRVCARTSARVEDLRRAYGLA